MVASHVIKLMNKISRLI